MMTPTLKIKISAILSGCLLPWFAFAQSVHQFKYRADIANIDSSGVYKIELQPDFIAKSVKGELYDIRIDDETGKFVAYSIITNPLDKVKPVFVDFPEVKPNTASDSATIYIAENKGKTRISELWLQLKNTAVSRLANLSGSDDLQHWFAIREDIRLQDGGESENTEFDQVLNFPASDYRYFRVTIRNKNKDMVKVIRSGIYVSDEAGLNKMMLSPLPAVRLSSRGESKQTSYFVELGDSYLVNQLHLDVSSPKYYNRRISIYDVGNNINQALIDTRISSSGSNYFIISAKTNKLRVDIVNGDDNPLIIKDIRAYQQKQFAVSYLEKRHHYALLAGDSTANEVSYDLSFMHSEPLSQFSLISHSAVYENPAFGARHFAVKRDYTLLIWVSIAVVLLILGLLTWRMVKEITPKP
ncbi:hypothetical protein [Mucilaginibacter ginsenosidivorans]|uniref:DUF3999 domain-containing protein n=1 Tax=Mucilaginibacter ginsenosidivorans TaxID=398053 RepID=A0A5B8UYS8_9SPHI|nr:hypothetical protein [Mucilaginibacter ginsenosidivorans]QEC63521.1 hypothetical protein FRZ54_13350 [Mucilaginibacter ginsenosidivorans]